MSTRLPLSDGILAVDHHSHAGYTKPGDIVHAFEKDEIDNALGYLESNMPHEDFMKWFWAGIKRDDTELARLDAAFGVTSLIEKSRHFQSTTVHSVSLLKGARALYGDLSDSDLVAASLRERATDPAGLYDRALHLSQSAFVLSDTPTLDSQVWSPVRYKQIARIDPYLYPFGHPRYQGRGRDTPNFRRVFDAIRDTLLAGSGHNGPLPTLDEWLGFVETSLADRHTGALVGLKIASAYIRTLDIQPVSSEAARNAYASLRDSDGEIAEADYLTVSDFLIQRIAEMALKWSLPIQIHTGHGHGEPGLSLADANPLRLERFLNQPSLNRLRVILIHGGYPFTSEAAAVSREFGNVFLDFSWMPFLHRGFLTRTLQEWLEFLPADKVMYGSDTGSAEMYITSTRNARDSLDDVLTEGMREGLWTMNKTNWLAKRVLHENLCDVYGLPYPQ